MPLYAALFIMFATGLTILLDVREWSYQTWKKPYQFLYKSFGLVMVLSAVSVFGLSKLYSYTSLSCISSYTAFLSDMSEQADPNDFKEMSREERLSFLEQYPVAMYGILYMGLNNTFEAEGLPQAQSSVEAYRQVLPVLRQGGYCWSANEVVSFVIPLQNRSAESAELRELASKDLYSDFVNANFMAVVQREIMEWF